MTKDYYVTYSQIVSRTTNKLKKDLARRKRIKNVLKKFIISIL